MMMVQNQKSVGVAHSSLLVFFLLLLVTPQLVHARVLPLDLRSKEVDIHNSKVDKIPIGHGALLPHPPCSSQIYTNCISPPSLRRPCTIYERCRRNPPVQDLRVVVINEKP